MSTAITAQAKESFIIAGREFTSRLIIGTGKYRSYEEMRRAHEAWLEANRPPARAPDLSFWSGTGPLTRLTLEN